MDTIEIKKIVNSKEEVNESDLYNDLIVLDKENTGFNMHAYEEMITMSMFMYNLNNNLQNLAYFELPDYCSGITDYKKFKESLNKYKEIYYKNPAVLSVNNMYDELIRVSGSKLLDNDDWYWSRFTSSSITNIDNKTDGKIYLSIDNAQLYNFGVLFYSCCLNEGLDDFNFKLNNNIKVNRRDNMVIYFNKDNVNKYLSFIDRILEKNPDFVLNEPHLLGEQLSNNAVIAKDSINGTSYTKTYCSMFLELNKYMTKDESVDYLEKRFKPKFEELETFIDSKYIKNNSKEVNK